MDSSDLMTLVLTVFPCADFGLFKTEGSHICVKDTKKEIQSHHFNILYKRPHASKIYSHHPHHHTHSTSSSITSHHTHFNLTVTKCTVSLSFRLP